MTSFWNKIKNFKGLKDLSSLGIGNITSSGISGVFWFYLAALIGTEGYGELSYLLAINPKHYPFKIFISSTLTEFLFR